MKQNGIKFNSFTGNILGRSKTIGHNDNKGMTIDMFEDNEVIPSVINSLEIDWNGAEVIPGNALSTTGEVLSILQTAYNYATTYNVKYSDGKLYDDKGTEIKVGTTLSAATTSALGGIKIGYTTSGKNYAVKLDGNSNAYVNVPWTDTTVKVNDLSAQGNVLFLTGTTNRNNHESVLEKLHTYNIGITTQGNLVKFAPDSVAMADYKAFIHTINGKPSKDGEFTIDVAEKNHNHIGTSNSGNSINAKDQNLTYFNTGWYRIGYFGWNDVNNITGSHNLMFNISSDGYYRSSSICGSIIQGATRNYTSPQAKINIINASKFDSVSKPVFDAIRTVKELIVPEINASEAIKEPYSTYGYPSQITYVDVHITQDPDESKQLPSLSNNVSYMFSGNGKFIYDNTLLKVPAFNSSFESIKSKDNSKTAYIRRTITYKPIEYTSNDNTTYLYFGSESASGTYSYNNSTNPVRIGSSALITPKASEDVIYSTNDGTYISIAKQTDNKSVKVTPTSSVTSSRKTTVYCTTASGSIVKSIEIYVDKANNAINSVSIAATDSISTPTDTGVYKATVSTSGSVGTLSYNWEITSGGTYATISNAAVNPVTIQAKNGTSTNQSVTLKCTVSSSVSGVSSKYDAESISIPVGTTSGSINWAGDTLEYGGSAYLQTDTGGVSSTAYNDKISSYKWSVSNSNVLNLDGTGTANVTITNTNTTTSDVSCKVTCVVTFKSGLTHTMEKTINAKKQELKYYWYAGQTNPVNLNASFNPEGVEGWTKLTSTPVNIPIFKETSDWSEVQWYLACPNKYGFDTTFNGVKVGGWDITRNAVEIGGVMYDVWKCQALTDTVNTTLAKV